MRNEENIDHIVRSKHAITSLSLTYKVSIVCSFIIYFKEAIKHTRNFYFKLIIN